MSEHLESFYFSLADACDAVPADQRELFLAKLTLLLATRLDDLDAVEHCIALASRNLD